MMHLSKFQQFLLTFYPAPVTPFTPLAFSASNYSAYSDPTSEVYASFSTIAEAVNEENNNPKYTMIGEDVNVLKKAFKNSKIHCFLLDQLVVLNILSQYCKLSALSTYFLSFNGRGGNMERKSLGMLKIKLGPLVEK